MSTVSGEAANRRRHARLRDPKLLDPECAAEIYAIARERYDHLYFVPKNYRRQPESNLNES